MVQIIKAIYNAIFPIKGGGNIIRGTHKFHLLGKIIIRGRNNKIVCNSKQVWKDVRIKIYGDNNTLIIKDGVVIKKGLIWFEDSGGLIELGEHTTIEGAELAIAGNNMAIKVGSDCMFSSDIRITTTDSHSVTDMTCSQRLNPEKSVYIGNHVWLGKGVQINKGVIVEDNSIIAGHSVVTKSCPRNTISAGIPAKIVRSEVNWLRNRI